MGQEGKIDTQRKEYDTEVRSPEGHLLTTIVTDENLIGCEPPPLDANKAADIWCRLHDKANCMGVYGDGDPLTPAERTLFDLLTARLTYSASIGHTIISESK